MSRRSPVLLPLALLGLSACGLAGADVHGSGTVRTEARPVSGFTGVTVGGSLDVDITIGGATKVEVIADDNLLPIIRTEVKGDQLVIDARDSYSTRSDVLVRITVPRLAALSVSGAADGVVRGVAGDALALAVSGSGSIKASGQTRRLSAQVSGSGDLHARDLRADTASASVSGSGDVDLTVRETLAASVSGSGSIDYWGKPGNVVRNISGSGTIEGH